jgi:hypothetical protein
MKAFAKESNSSESDGHRKGNEDHVLSFEGKLGFTKLLQSR